MIIYAVFMHINSIYIFRLIMYDSLKVKSSIFVNFCLLKEYFENCNLVWA